MLLRLFLLSLFVAGSGRAASYISNYALDRQSGRAFLLQNPTMKKEFTLLVYDGEGHRDPSFGVQGVKHINPAGDFRRYLQAGDRGLSLAELASASVYLSANDLVVDSEGRVLVTGNIGVYKSRRPPKDPLTEIFKAQSAGSHVHNFAYVLRLLPNGATDPSFGEEGFAFVEVSTSLDDVTQAIALTPRGFVLATAMKMSHEHDLIPELSSTLHDAITLHAFTSDGHEADSSFGKRGRLTVHLRPNFPTEPGESLQQLYFASLSPGTNENLFLSTFVHSESEKGPDRGVLLSFQVPFQGQSAAVLPIRRDLGFKIRKAEDLSDEIEVASAVLHPSGQEVFWAHTRAGMEKKESVQLSRKTLSTAGDVHGFARPVLASALGDLPSLSYLALKADIDRVLLGGNSLESPSTYLVHEIDFDGQISRQIPCEKVLR